MINQQVTRIRKILKHTFAVDIFLVFTSVCLKLIPQITWTIHLESHSITTRNETVTSLRVVVIAVLLTLTETGQPGGWSGGGLCG